MYAGGIGGTEPGSSTDTAGYISSLWMTQPPVSRFLFPWARGFTGIVLSGRLTPERIRKHLDEGAPIDVFHDAGYIAQASPMSFLPNIRTISDKPVPQETEPPPPNTRLIRVL